MLGRLVDEYRFGLRDLSIDDLRELISAWSELNDGETPAETMLRLVGQLRE